MENGHTNPPSPVRLVNRLLRTGLGALHNRSELFLVELQEEKNRVIELAIWAGVALFMVLVFVLVFTATIIFLFPENLRVYVAGAFSFVYLAIGVFSLINLKTLVGKASLPFAETISEVKKDREWLESLK